LIFEWWRLGVSCSRQVFECIDRPDLGEPINRGARSPLMSILTELG
jgi:hypothetical protein